MGTTAHLYKDLPLPERIELAEDIWDSIALETPPQPRGSCTSRARLTEQR